MPYNSDGIGYQGGDTSRAAAHDMRPKAETLREKIVAALHASPFPMTSEEIAEAIGKDYGSVQPRTAELRREGKIRDSGSRRLGRWGKSIIAWEIGKEGA